MILNKLFYIFAIVIFKFADCRDLSSLTFVIDVTSSMWNDISEVKLGASALLDTVVNHRNESQIDNFVLVTFNDIDDLVYNPDSQVKANTKDKDKLQSALFDLRSTGGGSYSCAELPMLGIKRALEVSLPKSYIYVFTDATARDYEFYEEVKGLALDKQSQIVFGLTGRCTEHSITSPEYKVYQDLALATGGQVFNIKKGEVHNLLDYVNATLTGRRTTVNETKLTPGTHNVTFNTDVLMGELLISLTSTDPFDPTVNVFGRDGEVVQKKILFVTDRSKVFSIDEYSPGPHTVEITTKVPTSVSITAKDTGLELDHGFSGIIVPSIVDTSSRPAPGQKSYLSINLKEGDVTLNAVQFLDMEGKVLQELPVVMNNRTKLYTTPAFDPPNTMFRVKINACYPGIGCNITRMLPPTDKINPTPSIKTYKAPTIVIRSGGNINVNYGKSLDVVCEVDGSPEPEIVWKNKETGTILSKEATMKRPDVFISVLSLEKAITNATYVCEATNPSGSSSEQITVQVTRPRYLRIVETSGNVTVEYEKSGTIFCTIEAYPPAHITWFKNDLLLKSDDNIKISSDKTAVTFEKASPGDKGKYTCEARNEDTTEYVDLYVTITGLVPASIIPPRRLNRTVIVGQTLRLACKYSGVPKPQIQWIYKRISGSEPAVVLNSVDGNLNLDDIQIYQEGNYTCIANNTEGTSQITYTVHVYESPVIDKNITEVTVARGSSAVLECKIIKGHPKPKINWYFRMGGNDADSSTFEDVPEWNNMEKIFLENAQKMDSGTYLCEARNKVTKDEHEINLVVEYPPTILAGRKLLKLTVGKKVSLSCKVDGSPRPEVTWYKNNRPVKYDGDTHIDEKKSLVFDVKLSDRGFYFCEAKNKLGTSKSTPVKLVITEPPTILEPKTISKAALVGSNLHLPCRSEGNPRPTTKWTYQSFSASRPSRINLKKSKDGSLYLKHIQVSEEGYYKCNAINAGGIASVTYEIQVFAPPTIENIYKEKRFVAVEGDLSLQITCKTTGNPRPSVTWKKDGVNLVLGSTYFVLEGTLIIENVPKDARGFYTCIAENPKGTAEETYQVIVEKYPQFYKYDSAITVTKGSSEKLECPISHEATDQLRWYKDGDLIYNGEFVINNAKEEDSGYYTCRISNVKHSYTRTIRVDVV